MEEHTKGGDQMKIDLSAIRLERILGQIRKKKKKIRRERRRLEEKRGRLEEKEEDSKGKEED